MSNTEKKSVNISLLGVFSAIVVILQMLSYFVKIGTFSLSLVLVPVIISGIIYGPTFSTITGTVFGVVTFIACIMGLDAGGAILLGVNPFLTGVVCILKGAAAGLVSGLVANALKNSNSLLRMLCSAVTAPVINTGLFIVMMLLFFKDTLAEWAGGSDLTTYILFGLVGVNFIIELSLNLVLTPTLIRVTKVLSKTKNRL